MEVWKSAVETKTAEWIKRGALPQVAHKRALKAARALHPAHKQAVAQRVELADCAIQTTGEFHSL